MKAAGNNVLTASGQLIARRMNACTSEIAPGAGAQSSLTSATSEASSPAIKSGIPISNIVQYTARYLMKEDRRNSQFRLF
jgi:hypothetical protein